MIRLSVNVNKVATLRNSQRRAIPSVLDAVRDCVDAGVPGITVHPRADARHITSTDVREVAALLRTFNRHVEFNIEVTRGKTCSRSCTRETDPVHARSRSPWWDHQSRLAGHPIRLETRLGRSFVAARARHSRQPVRGSRGEPNSMGGRSRRPIAWGLYTEPFARAFERGGAGRF